jgi:predicted dehydrogenase
MMVDSIRLGLIGAGGMANSVHYPSLAELPEVEMSALCDIDAEKLNSTADRFGIDARYHSYVQMLEETKPDAAYILMPPHQLYDLVVHCLSKGIHVFIEKPPGITSYQTRQFAEHAKRNECLTMVGFNRRYIPLMTRVKEMSLGKGPVLHAVASFYKNMIDAPPYYDGAIDVLTCDVIHAVDALRWMCGGELVKLASTVRSLHAGYENAFNALAAFDSGATGVLMSNWAAGTRVHAFEMHSKGFSAYVNPSDGAKIYDESDEATEITAQEVAGSDSFHKTYGFFDENKHFIDSIREGSEPGSNFEDATKTMELVDRIYSTRL